MDTGAVLAIARQEFTITARNKWTVVFAVVFGILVVGLSSVGILAEGFTGMQDFTRTSASLLNLVLYVVPLVALTMGTLSFAGDRSAAELLFAQPLTRAEVLLGKWLGVFWSLALSTIAGFLIAGIIIVASAGGKGVLRYGAFVLLSLGLSMSFLSIAALASSVWKRTSRTFGASLFLWFFFVILYDLLALGGSLLLRGPSAGTFLIFSLFGNPVDMVRVGVLILLDNATIFGAAGAALLRFLGGQAASLVLLTASLAAWIIFPLIAALRLLRTQDL